jgi:hypothetical protein
MFFRVRDASKVALASLVTHLRARRFTLFDIQQCTPHTESLGAIDIPRQEYLRRLAEALSLNATFGERLETSGLSSVEAGTRARTFRASSPKVGLPGLIANGGVNLDSFLDKGVCVKIMSFVHIPVVALHLPEDFSEIAKRQASIAACRQGCRLRVLILTLSVVGSRHFDPRSGGTNQ